jgi:hypothetical protein
MMSRVEGLLSESDAWPGWWAQLDDFAGPDYGRVLARVRRRDCGIVTAYLFVVQAGSRLAQADSARWGFAPTGAAHR